MLRSWGWNGKVISRDVEAVAVARAEAEAVAETIAEAVAEAVVEAEAVSRVSRFRILGWALKSNASAPLVKSDESAVD